MPEGRGGPIVAVCGSCYIQPDMRHIAAMLVVCGLLLAQETVDLSVVQRIRTEAVDNSQVMDHVFRMADVYGPRLTGSPAFQAAGEWAVKQLQE